MSSSSFESWSMKFILHVKDDKQFQKKQWQWSKLAVAENAIDKVYKYVRSCFECCYERANRSVACEKQVESSECNGE